LVHALVLVPLPPWITYRHFPPVIQAAFAIPPVPGIGGGFLPPEDSDAEFPLDPPTIGADGTFQRTGNSFFDVFFDVAGVCTVRPLAKPLADHDGDGLTRIGDFSRPALNEQRDPRPLDLSDTDGPDDVIPVHDPNRNLILCAP
jgi:hypothetical protein